MYGKAANQWSVHAELTISHAPEREREVQRGGTATHTEQNDNGVRMVYTWTTNPSETPATITPQTYGFQRGNMVFTSTPPRQDTNRMGTNVQDSGYGSEHLLSPNSYSSPRRPINPYNRRCRSTCSIILSTAINTDGHNIKCDTSASAQPTYAQCNRTQSLRCQTPSVRTDKRDLFYGCGDPWCYHSEEASSVRRCSPVFESCEECSVSNQSTCSKKPSRANTFTTHFCTRVPERSRSSPPNTRADMASQTVETSEKCTSPLEKFDDQDAKKKVRRDMRRRSSSSSRHNSDNNTAKTMSPARLAADSADSKKSNRRIARSPAVLRGRSPKVERKKSPARDSNKKPRTVHIDVYCTGSERDSESTSTSESDVSSPQTVYESGKCRVSHRRAGNLELPFTRKEDIPTIVDVSDPKPSNGGKDDRSDSDENASTCYPSALSSYSTVPDFASSISSVPPSWSTMSSSTMLEGYDSIAGTSCKDTVSDFESLKSKYSLAPTDSEYFIPRKLQPAEPEASDSRSTLFQSDSFDYEDAEDRERIRRMEQMWDGKNWKSPQSERKYLLQQQKMREFLEKRAKEKSKTSKDSESESAEDEMEQGWSFVRGDDGKMSLKRDETVLRTSKDDHIKETNAADTVIANSTINTAASKNKTEQNNRNTIQPKDVQPNITKPRPITSPNVLAKIEQSKSSPDVKKQIMQPAKNTSSTPNKQYFAFENKLRAPFTIIPGQPTEPLYTAQKFGSILGPVRKPGHHIGPTKNPDCLCEHCRRYYEDFACRNRTKSVGDSPLAGAYNWREILKSRAPDNVPVNYSDF